MQCFSCLCNPPCLRYSQSTPTRPKLDFLACFSIHFQPMLPLKKALFQKNHQTTLFCTSPNILEFSLHQSTTNSELITYTQILQLLFVDERQFLFRIYNSPTLFMTKLLPKWRALDREVLPPPYNLVWCWAKT